MNKYETSWTELNFIERRTLEAFDPAAMTAAIKWFEFPCTADEQWIRDVNSTVMDFGGVFHSIYLRWATTINGLHVATKALRDPQWNEKMTGLAVIGFRNDPAGGGPRQINVREWDRLSAAQVHESSVPMLAAWAFCNMYACLEEFVFKMFRIYLEANPMEICDGDDFKHLRKAYADKEKGVAQEQTWKELWSDRMESWHRKKLYDGLEKVFNNFVGRTRLLIPVSYEGNFNYSDIAKTLGGISLIRNCFIHGATTVPESLGEFCKTFQSQFFNFKTGDKFSISNHELAALEYFTDTFTQTLNMSLMELAQPTLRKISIAAVKSKD